MQKETVNRSHKVILISILLSSLLSCNNNKNSIKEDIKQESAKNVVTIDSDKLEIKSDVAFKFYDNESENIINIIDANGITLHTFNYISFYQKRICKLNDIVVGKLPKYDPLVKIIAWNNESNLFEVFLITKDSQYIQVDVDIGSKLYIICNFENDPWLYNATTKKLIHLDHKGSCIGEFIVNPNIIVDIISLQRANNEEIDMIIENIDEKEIYTINEKNGKVKYISTENYNGC